ncbi:MAG: DUF6049 family protein [Nocardioidaceae bacterium]|nr:DUF6049 family protein [Nocardioidaceae bacterium]
MSPSRRARACLSAMVAVALLVLVTLSGAGPAAASGGDGDRLDVRLTGLTPSALTGEPSTVTLTGTVANDSGTTWTDASVYLVVRPAPYVTREGLDAAIDRPSAIRTGERRLAASTTAALGTIAPGARATFRLTVPYADLGINGAEGVYPIGAQVLATDAAGERAGDAVGGAFTFLPLLGDAAEQVRTSLVIPFTAPVRRTTAGRYTDSAGLLALVAPDGRLRRLLDLARATVGSAGSTASDATTLMVDPALLDALEDLADRRYGPDREDVEEADAPSGESDAQRFVDDFVELAQGRRLWVLPYGQPDVEALLDGSDEPDGELTRAADAATDSALERLGLEGTRVSWPANGIARRGVVEATASSGAEVTLLSPRVLPDWSPSDGSELRIGARGGPTVLVRDPTYLRGGSDRDALSVRQRILAESLFAARAGGAAAQVVPVLGPGWDPGPAPEDSGLAQVLTAPWADPGAPTDDPRPWSDGIAVPASLRPTPVDAMQVDSARSALAAGRRLGAITADAAVTDFYRQGAALAVSQVWRGEQAEGARRALAVDRSVTGRLGRVDVETIPVLTLSGTKGRIPLSVTNDLDRPVTVGVRVESQAGGPDVADVEPFVLQAAQSQTIKIEVDVGESTNAVMTARLTTPQGTPFGEGTRFTVRSSVVGRTVWIGMAGAGALVLVAFGRRFVLARRDRGDA